MSARNDSPSESRPTSEQPRLTEQDRERHCEQRLGLDGDDELVCDLLVALLAQHEQARADWAEHEDEQFLSWLATDHEVDRMDSELWTREEAELVARNIEPRIRAARAPVARIDVPTELRTAAVVGTASQVLEDAADDGCAPYLDLAAAAGAGRELWDEECEQWVVLPAALPQARYLALGVSGESMMPLMQEGDTVLVRLGPDVRRDAVVVARLPDGGYVIKQVGRLTGTIIELRSLNPAFPPLRIPRARDAVLGTVVMRWRMRT
jgi:phage repressor protein C with HTH and peptisase S24 domain